MMLGVEEGVSKYLYIFYEDFFSSVWMKGGSLLSQWRYIYKVLNATTSYVLQQLK